MIVEDCVAQIKQRYPGKWNDFYEDSAGMMLVELFAYITDLLLFYLERQANETYLPTATERQNLINLCKLVGYTVSGAKPAQVELRFSLREPSVRGVLIPAGTIVESQGGVVFETDEELRIEAGDMIGACPATEGETYVEDIGRSDGTALQEFFLPRASVIEIKRVAVGRLEWVSVDSVAEHDDTARVYMADLDAAGRARLSFGDGRNGQIPEKDLSIRVTYRIGGGVRGNVAANVLTIMKGVARDELGERVFVDVTNPEAASGGVNPESLDRIRLWAPRYFEAQNRCVTQMDYETVAMTFQDPNVGRISKARAVVRERSGEANVIRIYVLTYSADPGQPALASEPLKTALLKYIDRRKMLTDWIEIEDGNWKPVDIKGVIDIVRGYSRQIIKNDVERALKKLLNIELRRMGEELRISDVYAAIDNLEGVRHVELETPVSTVTADKNEILTLGDVVFTLTEELGDDANI